MRAALHRTAETAIEGKPGASRLEIRLALRMLGARIPDDTLGFTGHGKAASNQEVTAKVPDAERQDTWNQLAELGLPSERPDTTGRCSSPEESRRRVDAAVRFSHLRALI